MKKVKGRERVKGIERRNIRSSEKGINGGWQNEEEEMNEKKLGQSAGLGKMKYIKLTRKWLKEKGRKRHTRKN